MKKEWHITELIDYFTLTLDETAWLSSQAPHNQFGLAVFLKVFQYQGRFPHQKQQIASDIVEFISQQLGITPKSFEQYQWSGRTGSRNRHAIYLWLDIREATAKDGE